jgi:hypothetical protein
MHENQSQTLFTLISVIVIVLAGIVTILREGKFGDMAQELGLTERNKAHWE